ncbi:MAG: SMP-30/gluconolactonase/LRE family protein, partial [Blastocatellia bacterium]|nr:SMP-30/gluconolactonase/LRE family protein [Blastocatellia bacterium]
MQFKRQLVWLTLAAAVFGSACGSAEPVATDFTRVATLAGQGRSLGEPFGIATRDGHTYISDGTAGTIVRIAPDGTLATVATGLSTPSGIAFVPDGSLLVADTGTHTIKKVDAAGAVTLVAGAENAPGDADGTVADARFTGPIGIAATAGGRIYVADTYNDAIRVIENGAVRTIAGGLRGFADGHGTSAKFELPLGLALWQGDKVLVADAGNRRIRVIEPDGRVWTLAGSGSGGGDDGFPSQASFEMPTAVTVDAHGIIYVADGNAMRSIGRRAFAYVETLSHRRRGLSDGLPHHARFNRPSGVAVNDAGELLVADSDNVLVRSFTNSSEAALLTAEDARSHHYSAEEFRALAPGRWPYDPPERTREIAGTLGEIRGEIVDQTSEAWFHNGLDIPGSFGETARFIREETVLDPAAAQNFNTARELIRMPTMGYVHIRIGREAADRFYPDARFQFNDDPGVPPVMRVPRGARFAAGEPMGTLNSQNHVHLIAGRSGFEMNALD